MGMELPATFHLMDGSSQLVKLAGISNWAAMLDGRCTSLIST